MAVFGNEYSPAISVQTIIEELDLFEGLSDAVEEQINVWPQKIDAAKPEILQYDDGYIEEEKYVYGMSDSTWHFDTVFYEYFPNVLRRALMISLFSFLETKLTKLCKCFEDIGHLKLSINDIASKGGWDKKIEKYLLKVVGINFPLSLNSWMNINYSRELRNLFVHHNGNIKMIRDTNVKQFIEKSNYLQIIDDEVRINEGFLLYLLKEMKIFLSVLLQEIKIFHSEQQS